MTQTTVPPNRLRARLAEGRPLIGTMVVELRQPSIMFVLADAGLDFCLIDSEHGPFSIESIATLSRAGRITGVTPIVRIPEITYAHITQPLDAGAQGIMIPRVTGPEQVRFCLECMKYPPDGRRGVVMARGHTDFRGAGGPLAESLAAMNRETFLVVQIETSEAVNRLDELLSIPGVDAALVGPTDLSVSLGIPGQMENPALSGAIERTIAACQKHAVVPAIHTNDVAATAAWARRGMRLVSISSEMGLLLAGLRNAVGTIRGER